MTRTLLNPRSRSFSTMRVVWTSAFFFLAVGFPSFRGPDSNAQPSFTEWPTHGNDPGGAKHSTVAQINRDNVTQLKQAWTYRTGLLPPDSPASEKGAFEATPILVDGTLYVATPLNRVIALDPETGREKWVFDPKVDPFESYSEVTCRGVSTWAGKDAKTGKPTRRIFVATLDARLIALDSGTGKPCADFGKNGEVDLTEGIRVRDRDDYQVTSPPAVIGDLIVVGSSVGDNRAVDCEPGTVRAFDARTGAHRWSWDPIPRSASLRPPGSWEGTGAEKTGAANAWSIISVDAQRGLVFVPTSSPSPDYYGGERLGRNDYANSVVALAAKTGRVAWSFQVVHHDLWDYDVASQPMLVTLKKDGKDVPAVVVGTKMGHLFVLDRLSGKPLFPVEERPVPASDVPGEKSWPTQPFPVLPEPVGSRRLTEADAWGVTETDKQWCREKFKSLRHEGIFTPPSLEGSLVYPGNVGGLHWGGMSFDPARNLVVFNTNRVPFVIKLIPRAEVRKFAESVSGERLGSEFGRQLGTPYVMYRRPLLAPSGLPCLCPPWGTLAAVDLSTGKLRWEVPLGMFPGVAGVPGSSGWGSFNLGGSMTTAGGLVFVAAAMDTSLRAFDVETGKEIWKAELPASAQAAPMSYVAKNGRQYVVVAAGGHGKLGTKKGDYVVAYALP